MHMFLIMHHKHKAPCIPFIHTHNTYVPYLSMHCIVIPFVPLLYSFSPHTLSLHVHQHPITVHILIYIHIHTHIHITYISCAFVISIPFMCKQHQYASYYYICFHSYSYITYVSTDLYQSHNASYIHILYISNKIQTSIQSYDLNTHHSHILIYIHMCLFNHALQAYAIHLCITCICFPFTVFTFTSFYHIPVCLSVGEP